MGMPDYCYSGFWNEISPEREDCKRLRAAVGKTWVGVSDFLHQRRNPDYSPITL